MGKLLLAGLLLGAVTCCLVWPVLAAEKGSRILQPSAPLVASRQLSPSSGAGDLPASIDPEGLRLQLGAEPEDGCYDPILPAGNRRRCEPQCIPYARCRSGIDSCRTGMENGPLTWFACEQRRGNTAAAPAAGSILILAANGRRKMPTGHGLYVEAVEEAGPDLYRLLLSHTNFDRRCSLETNIEAHFDGRTMSVDFLGGAWQPWGKDLTVAGFILGTTNRETP